MPTASAMNSTTWTIRRITGRRRRSCGGGAALGGCDALLAVIPGDPRLAGPVSGTVFPVDRPLIEVIAALAPLPAAMGILRPGVFPGTSAPPGPRNISSMDRSSPSVAQSASAVAGALIPRTSELSAEIYGLIVREIPQLRGDKRVLTLLEASVTENVATLLHVLQHDINLENVRAPAAAEEYARRLAQRGLKFANWLKMRRSRVSYTRPSIRWHSPGRSR